MNDLDLNKAVDLSAVLDKSQQEKASQLPKPQGYRILCAIPEAEKEFDSGIAKADVTLKNDEVLTTVLFVVSLGPVSYTQLTLPTILRV